MKRLLLGFVLIGGLMTASQVFAIDLIAGKEYFLRTPLYAPKDKDNQIDWINYSDVAEKLRAGENVSIIEIKGDTIKFMLNKKAYSFSFTGKGLAGTSGIYDKYFTTVDIREEIGNFDDRIIKNINLGIVAPGMTKE